jgi:hypothetical protein
MMSPNGHRLAGSGGLNALAIPEQISQVDGLMTPLPVHADHSDESSRRLGRLSQHGTRWKRYTNQAAS